MAGLVNKNGRNRGVCKERVLRVQDPEGWNINTGEFIDIGTFCHDTSFNTLLKAPSDSSSTLLRHL